MVVKEIVLEKPKQFLGRKWRQSGPKMHPSRNAISYTSFRCHGNSISLDWDFEGARSGVLDMLVK